MVGFLHDLAAFQQPIFRNNAPGFPGLTRSVAPRFREQGECPERETVSQFRSRDEFLTAASDGALPSTPDVVTPAATRSSIR